MSDDIEGEVVEEIGKTIVVTFLRTPDGLSYVPNIKRDTNVSPFEVPILLELATRDAYHSLGIER